MELVALLKYAWMVLGAWFWYDKNKTDILIEKMTLKLQETPTREEVEKEIFKSISGIKDDQKEVIIMTREMSVTLNQLVKDLAVLNTKWSMTNDKKD